MTSLARLVANRKHSEWMKDKKNNPMFRKEMQGIFEDAGNPRWRGDNASFQAMHDHIKKYNGSATHCTNPSCLGKGTKFEWSKIDHNTPYTRDVKDYQQLCCSCHQAYDRGLLLINGRYGKGDKYENIFKA